MNFDPMSDINDFHNNFGFTQPAGPKLLDDEHMAMRLNFMLEELRETADAIGFKLVMNVASPSVIYFRKIAGDPGINLEGYLDGLIDLAYVLFGTAWLTDVDIEEGWRRVHAANMRKVRATAVEQSLRGSTFDVVKPKGWKPASLADLVKNREE